MTESDTKIAEAWRRAAEDLEIRVIAPYVPPGRIEEYLALVQDFGSDNGMLLLPLDADRSFVLVARQLGFGYSQLGRSYEIYERTLFVDTLDDWGWSGDESAAPDWYSGKPWS